MSAAAPAGAETGGKGKRASGAHTWPPLPPPVPRAQLPRHVAIIMDGNGRWAQRRGLPRIFGHREGIKAVRDVVSYCGQVGIPFLTLYAFSTENWKRPRTEVRFLMRLLEQYLKKELAALAANQVRLMTIGRLDDLPAGARGELERTCAATVGNRGLTLSLALNYGSRDEWVEAARKLCAAAARGERAPESLAAADVEGALYTAGLPPVDLLVRSAGERRLSNFLLWQACGAVFHVADVCWPDFRRQHLEAGVRRYAEAGSRAGRG